MEELKGRSALVVGASSGIGRATLVALAANGMRVLGVARSADRLERIAREAPGEARAMAADATRADTIADAMERADPDLVVITLGARPRMASLDEQTWESFSEVWNSDVHATFHVCQAALRRPLRAGSTVVIVSSGAAIGGSPLSGGYAGAKRMQWLLAGYAQGISDRRRLGVRFVALLPKQLIVGTTTGEAAAAAYAAQAGITEAAFMERFGTPLAPEGVADAIIRIARGQAGRDATALAVTGSGIEAL